MHAPPNSDEEEFRPRLIVWRLTPDPNDAEDGERPLRDPLTGNERHLILEGIARTAKPIVVLTGDHLPQRTDVRELIEYGAALGLKMIVEALPGDLTPGILREYAPFGKKIFRVAIDGAVVSDNDTRFKKSAEFRELENTVSALRAAGFEIHLSSTVERPDVRHFAVMHDYAYRSSAQGFYCHLAIGRDSEADVPTVADTWEKDPVDAYIDAVANIKQYSSPGMFYLSPQCVKYGYLAAEDEPLNGRDASEGELPFEWSHWCLGGRSFAYISAGGYVKLCSRMSIDNGDLRETGYDFKRIWQESRTFGRLRGAHRTCSCTNDFLREKKAVTSHGKNE